MAEDDSQSESGSSHGGAMPSAVFEISRRGLNALAVSPDGTRLATAARDGIVRIHELTTGALLSGFRVCLAVTRTSDFRVTVRHRLEKGWPYPTHLGHSALLSYVAALCCSSKHIVTPSAYEMCGQLAPQLARA